MKLRGRRVLINAPAIEKSAIELTPEVQESIDRENMKKWTSLKVYAVGDQVTDIEDNDEVYIAPSGLERAVRLEVDGQVKFLVEDFDISIIW